MRRLLLVLGMIPVCVFGLGDLCHNYVANQAQAELSINKPEAAEFLARYHDAYLVGSDYPDVGYAPGHNFGELAHWPNFVDPFIAYIQATYPHPVSTTEQNHRDRLVAFLMGVGTHIQSDIVSHWTYYEWVAKKDFHATGTDAAVGGKTYGKAHNLMDPGSDAYVTVRKGVWNHPTTWWVPIKDLVAVYAAMGHQISADELLAANAEYYVMTGLDEDLIAYPEYLYDALYAVPWGMKYFDNPDPQYGALPEMAHQSAVYAENIWERAHTEPAVDVPQEARMLGAKIDFSNPVQKEQLALVHHAVEMGWLKIVPHMDAFGAATFSPSSIKFNSDWARVQFQTALSSLVQSLLQKIQQK